MTKVYILEIRSLKALNNNNNADISLIQKFLISLFKMLFHFGRERDFL